MAYSRVNWEDGEKTADGYVTINGQNYTVVEPTYSGATAVDSTNLNIMDKGIKDLDDYLEETSKFSTTEETFTGKYWIDGKPIYRKVWTIGSSSTINEDVSVSAPITNLDKVVDFRGGVYFENYYVPWNFYNWANTKFSYIAFYRNGSINYRIANPISGANFIIEYTKTSESE